MNDRDWRRVKEVFHAVVALPAEARPGYLRQACGDDAALCAEVESLLAAADGAGALMASPTADRWFDAERVRCDSSEVALPQSRDVRLVQAAAAEAGRIDNEAGPGINEAGPGIPSGSETRTSLCPEVPGSQIGPYKLLERIGEGGFGTVYLAEQKQPVRRKVAVKVIKLGMDTRSVIARFEAERQALAMMDHPHIAKVFDAGATDTGRPYFVMELVKGVTITQYCDDQRVPLRERLALFTDVCHAVQHAHQKGIIHRDLKPSNVLVSRHDDKPVVKVIDFGIVKATGGRLTDQTIHTEWRQLIGTPAYMSPEQAGMSDLDVDTRSDIYSLGVLLYELLTGTPPFDPRQLLSAGFDEMCRIIREVEPPKPSTRVSGWHAQAKRGHEVSDAEHGRGFASAMPHGSSELRTQHSALAVAQHRRSDPQALARSLRGDLDWIVMKCLEKDRTRRYETANSLAADMRRYLDGEPVLATPPSKAYHLSKFVRRNKGGVLAGASVATALLLGGIGTTAGMLQALRSADETRHQAKIARDNEIKAQEEAASAQHAAELARQERDKAERIARFMSDIFQGVTPSVALGRDTAMLREMLNTAAARIEKGELHDSPDAELRLRWTIGSALQDIAADGALQRAETFLLPTLSLAERFSGPESEEMAVSLSRVADSLDALGRTAEALPKCEAALAIRRKLFHGDHAKVAESLNDAANCLASLRQYAEALSNAEAALEMRQRLFPGNHPDVASSLDLTANCLSSLARDAEALPKYQAALAMRQRLFPGDRPEVAGSLHNLAVCVQALGRSTEALPKFEAALEMNQRVYPHEHPETATSLSTLAGCLLSLDRAQEALPKFEAALAMRQRLFDGDRPELAGSLNNLGLCLRALAKPAEALPRFEAAHEMNRRLYGDDHPELAATLGNLGLCLQSLGRSAEAEQILAEILVANGNLAEAIDGLRTLVATQKAQLPSMHVWRSNGLAALGSVPLKDSARQSAVEAESLLAECLDIREKALGPGHVASWVKYESMNKLGTALAAQGKFVQAEPLLLDGFEGMKHDPRVPPATPLVDRKREALEGIIKLYTDWDAAEPGHGYGAKAAQWRLQVKPDYRPP